MIDIPAIINISGIDFYVNKAETRIEYESTHSFLDGSRSQAIPSLLYVNLRLVCTTQDLKQQIERRGVEEQKVLRRKFNLEEL